MAEVDVVSLIGPGALDGRVALVTGSSSGIGAAIAGRVAERGATVVVDSRSRVEASGGIAATRGATSCAPADVGDPEDAERLVTTTVERHGHLDILVNATGAATAAVHGDADGGTAGDWGPVLRATIVGAWNVVRAAEPHLRAAGGGVIINVSSTAGSAPAGPSIPHAVCEAGMSHLTALLANALRPEIRVYAAAAVDPGMEPCHGARWARQSHRRRKDDPRFGWESLTTAERRVAEAVGSGLTNVEAAQRLFVSPFTVDYHLRHIFLKLGIKSRVRLAVVVKRN